MFRFDGNGWQAIDEPLPEFAHAPVLADPIIAPWVLPRSVQVQPGDVLVIGEQAHRLLTPIPGNDPAWHAVASQAGALATAEQVAEWIASIELWLGQRLPLDREWPAPSA